MLILERLSELIEGAPPEDYLEGVFITVYTKALRGISLASVCIELLSDTTEFTKEELDHIIYGYLLGQKVYMDNNAIKELKSKDETNTNLH